MCLDLEGGGGLGGGRGDDVGKQGGGDEEIDGH